MIPYNMTKCLIIMAIIGTEKNYDNKALVYVIKRHQKHELADILDRLTT